MSSVVQYYGVVLRFIVQEDLAGTQDILSFQDYSGQPGAPGHPNG